MFWGARRAERRPLINCLKYRVISILWTSESIEEVSDYGCEKNGSAKHMRPIPVCPDEHEHKKLDKQHERSGQETSALKSRRTLSQD